MDECLSCDGLLEPSRLLFECETPRGLVSVNVPCTRCNKCGEEWLPKESSKIIEAEIEKLPPVQEKTKMNTTENENCDDFYEIRVFLGGKEVRYDMNSWDCFACPYHAEDTARRLASKGEFDYVQVTSHGTLGIAFEPIVEGAVIWDSRPSKPLPWWRKLLGLANSSQTGAES